MKATMFVGLALFCSVVLASLGCREGGGDVGNTASAAVSAKNIVFRNSAKSSADRENLKTADETVYADNVILSTSSNVLSSTNLQDALDNELAIDLATLLPGTTWKVTNKGQGSSGEWGGQCQITFAQDGKTFNVDYGNFAGAAFIQDTNNGNRHLNPVSYELTSNSTMFLTFPRESGPTPEVTVVITARGKDTLTFIGNLVNSSNLGVPTGGVSVLTRVQ